MISKSAKARLLAKDKRISFLSIFSSLCRLYAGKEKHPALIEITEQMVEDLMLKYPMVDDPIEPTQGVPIDEEAVKAGAPF
jgi:hypothetical protein